MKKYGFAIVYLFLANFAFSQTQTFDKVGIGITPSYPLHIYEKLGQSTSLMIDAEADANPNIYFKSAGHPVGNIRYFDSGNGNLQIQTGNPFVSAIDISMDGKVGIGNISPQHTLDVNGDLFVSQKLKGSSFTIDLDGGDSSYPKRITSEQLGGAATMELQTYSGVNHKLQTRFMLRGSGDDNIEFYDRNENEFVCFNGTTGNVLIGKASQTNTSYKLDVNGNVRANKVVVNTTGADFVFDPDYALPPLDSLERYIQTQRHLPGMPTATEMQRQGLDVGESQTRLLQKLEEMILYTIEQDKQLQTLRDRNKTQQTRLQTQQQLLDQLSAVVKAQETRLKTLETKLTR